MVTMEMIEAARKRLEGKIRRTPLLSSPFLDEIAGRRLFVKAECLQHSGSFKFRGAWSAVSALDPDVRAKGVIAFSSGNHAQGVALAAKLHGIPSVIVMPSDAPKLKVANTRAFGAEVVLYDRAREDRDKLGTDLAAERGLKLIKPFDEPLVISGQASMGLELCEQAQEEGISSGDILVPCGGGGLTSGIALAVADRAPQFRVHPCEPEAFDDTTRSLASGKIESNATMTGSICDAIVTPHPGQITFPIMRQHCAPGVVVTDEEALRAMALVFLRLKIVLEPGGAVAVAAALFHSSEIDGDAVIAVASGGNVDPDVFEQALRTL